MNISNCLLILGLLTIPSLSPKVTDNNNLEAAIDIAIKDFHKRAPRKLYYINKEDNLVRTSFEIKIDSITDKNIYHVQIEQNVVFVVWNRNTDSFSFDKFPTKVYEAGGTVLCRYDVARMDSLETIKAILYSYDLVDTCGVGWENEGWYGYVDEVNFYFCKQDIHKYKKSYYCAKPRSIFDKILDKYIELYGPPKHYLWKSRIPKKRIPKMPRCRSCSSTPLPGKKT